MISMVCMIQCIILKTNRSENIYMYIYMFRYTHLQHYYICSSFFDLFEFVRFDWILSANEPIQAKKSDQCFFAKFNVNIYIYTLLCLLISIWYTKHTYKTSTQFIDSNDTHLFRVERSLTYSGPRSVSFCVLGTDSPLVSN